MAQARVIMVLMSPQEQVLRVQKYVWHEMFFRICNHSIWPCIISYRRERYGARSYLWLMCRKNHMYGDRESIVFDYDVRQARNTRYVHVLGTHRFQARHSDTDRHDVVTEVW